MNHYSTKRNTIRNVRNLVFLILILISNICVSQVVTRMTSNVYDNVRDLWGTANNNIYAVGEVGIILHYDGTSWTPMSSGTYYQLNTIFGFSNNEIYAVGGDSYSHGIILKFDGQQWTTAYEGGTGHFTRIFGFDHNNIYAVGYNGAFFHFNGSTWIKEAFPYPSANLRAVWGTSPDNLYLADFAGNFYQKQNNTWNIVSSTGTPTYDIWGSSASDIFVTENNGKIWHFDGGSWQLMTTNSSYYHFDIMGFSSKQVYTVGQAGEILFYNGTTWSKLNNPYSDNLASIWGLSPCEMYASGNNGTILKITYSNDFSAVTNCSSKDATFSMSNSNGVSSVSWDFGDPSSGSSNNSALNSPTHTFTQSGTYSVKMNVDYGSCSKSIEKTVKIENMPQTVMNGIYVRSCGVTGWPLTAGNNGATYLWSTGETSQTIVAHSTGVYSVKITNGCGSVNDFVNISLAGSLPKVELGSDMFACGGAVQIEAPVSDVSYLWSNGSTNKSITVNSTGQYAVTVTNSCGSATDNIQVTFDNISQFHLPDDATVCAGENFVIDASSTISNSSTTYLWSSGGTAKSITVNSTGLYSVTATNQCGSVFDVIQVTFDNINQFRLPDDATICTGDHFVIDASTTISSSSATYLWSNGSTAKSIIVNSTGLYSVTATNHCGSVSDGIQLTFNDINQFHLPDDATICAGEHFVIDASATISNSSTTYLWSNGSTAKSITVSSTGLYSVMATNQCGSVSDNIQITLETIKPFTSLNDAWICKGETFVADATTNATIYLWNDGSTLPVKNIKDEGIYTVTARKTKCSITKSFKLTVKEKPQISKYSSDTAACKLYKIEIPYNSTSQYLWNDGVINPSRDIEKSGKYTLSAQNECGVDQAVFNVEISACISHLTMPNIMTPNNDGVNDELKPNQLNILHFKGYIYNRWGKLLFEWENPAAGWNGTYQGNKVSDGIYYYTDNCGNLF